MAYNRKYGKKKSSKGKPRAKKTTKGKKQSFAAKVKNVIMRTAETKMLPYGHNVVLPRQLYHDSYAAPYPLDGPNQLPAQGITDTTRVGDEIYASHIRVQMLLGQKLDRKNVTFRIIVIRCTAGASPVTYPTLFIGTTDNCLLDDVNRDRVSVVKDVTIKKIIGPDLSGVGGADKEFTFPYKFTIPVKQKIKFPTDGDTAATNRKSLYMYVFAYDAFGTLVTDNIAYVQTYSTLYYKDP